MHSAEARERVVLRSAFARARDALLDRRSADGFWLGELSSSALSTATAVAALAIVQRETRSRTDQSSIESGLDWLARHQNADGGWGDTVVSLSNISTTTLVWAAFGAAMGGDPRHPSAVQQARAWLARHGAGDNLEQLPAAILARYGRDRTFSAPILTMCALAGRLGEGRAAWRHVLPLPFELAALPHQLFAAARLPVVSYALPALIAIGQARHRHAPSDNPLARLARRLTCRRTLRILTEIQPGNGGFLEATPLTSFVTMSLAGSGLAEHVVARRGAEFLRGAQRPDGSWPIDTNLSTWVTTLAVNALGPAINVPTSTPTPAALTRAAASPTADEFPSRVRGWLLAQQYRTEHPYTHAAPGGWAWTNLPGGVPDADDTAGALLALRQLGAVTEETRAAVQAGIHWLLDLQNRDGGIPTFCRGWGALPFDQSSPDITAHAVRAWLAWNNEMPSRLQATLHAAILRAIGYLKRVQRADGSWRPLWFGNQFARDDENPLYGTARVFGALAASVKTMAAGNAGAAVTASVDGLGATACTWLVRAQNPDGGWGGAVGVGSSVEETGLAVEALGLGVGARPGWKTPEVSQALRRGIDWLQESIESGRWMTPAPIGFYFAKLWYFETLYPLIFTVGALRQALEGDAPGLENR
jgi:squalene-hopene/tetraprenyl-beta-curcumene cyclase